MSEPTLHRRLHDDSDEVGIRIADPRKGMLGDRSGSRGGVTLMAVYVDQLRDWGWRLGPSCHLIADSNEELHAFAAKIGMKRAWFQAVSSGPHYDLTASKRQEAVRLGAVELEDRPFHEILKRWKEAAIARIKAATTEEERQSIRADLYR